MSSWAEGGGKVGQGPRQGSSSRCNSDRANAAAERNSPNYAFLTQDIAAATNNKATQIKIIDMGATSHYSPHRADFVTFQNIEPHPYKTADRAMPYATGIGDLKSTLPNRNTSSPVTLKNTLYTPNMKYILISVSKLDLANFEVCTKDCACKIFAPDGKLIGQVLLEQGLYKLTAKSRKCIGYYRHQVRYNEGSLSFQSYFY